jgi:hypothetical protein
MRILQMTTPSDETSAGATGPDPAAPAEPAWMLSPWDHQVHAFAAGMIGEVVAQALCSHSARSSALDRPHDDSRVCPACRLIVDRMAATASSQSQPDWRSF